jgi:predicted secreted protein
MAANIIKGNRINLSWNGLNISCQTSCELSFDAEMIGASSVSSARWKEHVSGIRSWSFNVNAKVLRANNTGADIRNVLAAYLSGQRVFMEMKSNTGDLNELTFSGYVLVQSGGIQAGSTGAATWNGSFQGTGALNTNVEDFGLIIDAMPIEAEWPIIYNTTL